MDPCLPDPEDAEALPIVFDLLKHEGLCLGELVRGQCRRRYTPRPRTRPGSTLSSPFSPTTAPAIRASCCPIPALQGAAGAGLARVALVSSDYVRPQAALDRMAGRASLRSGPADRRWQLPFARGGRDLAPSML